MADIDNLLGMIAAGRIDASLLGLWTAKTHLAALGLETRLSYRIVPVPASDSAMRFGLRKSFPHNREIVSKVDGAIKAMRDSGEIGRIIQRYGP
jgi:ABC-type amino acid transport substrate-binding protein